MATMHRCGILGAALLIASWNAVDAQYENCTGLVSGIKDGFCDPENNNFDCEYDGGDCCQCTCVDGLEYNCGNNTYDCRDPGAGDVLHDCHEAPSIAVPCSSDRPLEMVVQDRDSAAALVEAIQCSGGTFHVEWRGNIVVDETIYVANGTTLNVTGADSEAGIEGGLRTRLFTVRGASLYISNMRISKGYSSVGGAIAAVGSRLSFNQTSFLGNVASAYGGSLYIIDESSVDLGGLTSFVENIAGSNGGAFYVRGSSVSWSGEMSFFNNSAVIDGGALYAESGSNVSWNAVTTFSNNDAGDRGGALYIRSNTSVRWQAETGFCNNSAYWEGGALYVISFSSVFWQAQTSFRGSTALRGGALYVYGFSSLHWTAETHFIDNVAGYDGGALSVEYGSTVLWQANTIFLNNSAGQGGASLDLAGSSVHWEAETSFLYNTAYYGGALNIRVNASASWRARTSFHHNNASGGVGGAIYVQDGANASWAAETYFWENSAGSDGGALFVEDSSAVDWVAETSFVGNVAGADGGALHMGSSSHVSWGAETSFLENSASGNGGALYVYDGYDETNPSSVTINGSTLFLKNSCGASGGGMVVTAASSVTFGTENITFSENSAAVGGGAVFVSGLGIGPRFVGFKFISNTAQVGGGVYATGCGTTITHDEGNIPMNNPTMFDRCEFVGNEATATGGAVDTGAGLDTISNTSFVGNSAKVGGALRLAGTASLYNCSFVDNVSDEDEGPAISNIGLIPDISKCSFALNDFDCDPGTYRHYGSAETPDTLFDVICSGCDASCTGCSVPGDAPGCAAEIERSNSTGGDVTLATLLIDPGCWRASNTSMEVLTCYNENACRGGLTGAPDYCRSGYEGPYCSICSYGYTGSLGFTCNKCPGDATSVVFTVVVAVMAMCTFVVLLFYTLPGDIRSAHREIWRRWKRHIPMTPLKIIVVEWQILTQFAMVANVTYPGVYQQFLGGIDVLNFDLGWVVSTGCIADLDFHDRLIVSTTAPLIGMGIIGVAYALARRKYRDSNAALDKARRKHLFMVLLLTFLVYSSVSSTLFQMFACDELDDDKIYLRADYRIQCDSSKHHALQVYAAFMILLYTGGVPSLYAALLFRSRKVLIKIDREDDSTARSISALWAAYKPHRYYFELIECARRIMLAGILVFIYPNTATQVAVTLMMAVFFMVVYEVIAPYESRWDAWINRAGQAIVCTSVYVALLLKVDVSDKRASSQKVFEDILVVAHVCMVLVVVVEAVTSRCSLRRDQREDSNTEFPDITDVPVAFQVDVV